MNQNIILSTDYHDENCVIRWLDEGNGQEQVHKIATCPKLLGDLVARAEAIAKPRGGQVVWIQESTTGWARVEALLGRRVRFHLANVLQMPLPPKGNDARPRILRKQRRLIRRLQE